MRKVQPVSFSLDDQFEKALLEHALSNGKFSKYVKRLIQRDKEGGHVVVPEIEKEIQPKGIASSFL
jgi:hypothetical protein